MGLTGGHLTETMRGDCPFAYGDTIRFGDGMYPLHETEATYIKEHGLESFWDLDWDPYDGRRAPVC